MKIIDGKAWSSVIRAELKEKIDDMQRKPGLAVVIVGDDPASQVYVRNKVRACGELGIRSFSYELPKETTQAELEGVLDSLADNDEVDGILLQMPLPSHLNPETASAHIPFEKDVDGFSAHNLGLLMQNKQKLAACTPAGVMELLKREGVDVGGKNVVVLGRSETVGKPMALLLLNANATVTVCHSRTQGLKEICRRADVLISAVGKRNFVTEEMVKEGAVVIDVGINRNEEGKLCGDVDFEGVKEKASLITPVPGGVGPMTITMLMRNAYTLACKE